MEENNKTRIWLTLHDTREKYQEKRVAAQYRLLTGEDITAIGELWVYKKPRQNLFAVDLVFDHHLYPKIIRHRFHLTEDQVARLMPKHMADYDYKYDGILTPVVVKITP